MLINYLVQILDIYQQLFDYEIFGTIKK